MGISHRSHRQLTKVDRKREPQQASRLRARLNSLQSMGTLTVKPPHGEQWRRLTENISAKTPLALFECWLSFSVSARASNSRAARQRAFSSERFSERPDDF
jgi:hypothetical protein